MANNIQAGYRLSSTMGGLDGSLVLMSLLFLSISSECWPFLFSVQLDCADRSEYLHIYIHIGEVGVDRGLVHLNGAPGCGIQHRR